VPLAVNKQPRDSHAPLGLTAPGPTGRTYWEVRFDKKGAGLVKVGLAHLHEGGPGDPGLLLGHNWNDRRGVRCRSGKKAPFPHKRALAKSTTNDELAVQLVSGQ